MLPAETIKEIAEMARDATKPTSTNHGLGTLLIFKDKKTRFIPMPVPPTIRKLQTFDAFFELVATRLGNKVKPASEAEPSNDKDEGVPQVAHEGSAVYYSPVEFSYIESPGSLYGFRAAFSLVDTAQWKWLANESAKWADQPYFVRLLRIILKDCLPSSDLLAIVREVRFNTNTGATGNVQNARQSLSREMVEEVKGTGAIPEEVTLTMKPFENMPYSALVQCAVEIDTSTSTFRLTPFPGELRKCLDKVLAMAAEIIPDVPCYYGSAK